MRYLDYGPRDCVSRRMGWFKALTGLFILTFQAQSTAVLQQHARPYILSSSFLSVSLSLFLTLLDAPRQDPEGASQDPLFPEKGIYQKPESTRCPSRGSAGNFDVFAELTSLLIGPGVGEYLLRCLDQGRDVRRQVFFERGENLRCTRYLDDRANQMEAKFDRVWGVARSLRRP